jgi:molybdenum cofactor cytidylyltransferase
MDLPGRVFAVIPAAGASSRMFTQKLLLPWGDATMLDAVLANWTSSRAERVVVVCRDEPELLAICGTWGADVVRVDETPEMKDSISAGLDWICDQYAPQDVDSWMLAPADMPRIGPGLVADVIELGYREPATIALPRVGRHKGHPVFFPWSCANEVSRLAVDEGVNTIVRRGVPRFLETSDQGALQDLDTPEQYARLRPLMKPG